MLEKSAKIKFFKGKKINIQEKFQLAIDSINMIEERLAIINHEGNTVSNSEELTVFDSIIFRLQCIGNLFNSIENRNPEILKKHSQIDWTKILKFGNIISHYRNIKNETIFDTCKNDLPRLKTTIEQIINEI